MPRRRRGDKPAAGPILIIAVIAILGSIAALFWGPIVNFAQNGKVVKSKGYTDRNRTIVQSVTRYLQKTKPPSQ